MLTATLATLAAAPLVALAALHVFRALTASPGTGRHRVARGVDQYRPRSAAQLDQAPAIPAVPVVPGPEDLDATGVVDVRDMAVPVPAQRPLTPEMRALAEAIEGARSAIPDDVAAALGGALGERTREVARIQ